MFSVVYAIENKIIAGHKYRYTIICCCVDLIPFVNNNVHVFLFLSCLRLSRLRLCPYAFIPYTGLYGFAAVPFSGSLARSVVRVKLAPAAGSKIAST